VVVLARGDYVVSDRGVKVLFYKEPTMADESLERIKYPEASAGRPADRIR
jgi:hypothetical protein